MLPGLYSAATAMEAATVNQEVVAHNLAHVNVPGFRRSAISFSTFENALENELRDSQGLGTAVEEIQTDFTPGKIQTTGRQLDLALMGDGFFVLDGPAGPLYTRCGVFFRDAKGQLVNGEGLPVQGVSGPILLPPETAESQIAITADGYVTANGQPAGQLALVRFADPSQLVAVGTTSFQAPDGAATQPYEGPVVQGGRESSNVVAVEELIRMIAGLRHFEAAQRALRTIADTVEQKTNPRG